MFTQILTKEAYFFNQLFFGYILKENSLFMFIFFNHSVENV